MKDTLADDLVPLIADVRRKNRSLWIPEIDREVCNSGADLIESGRGVRDLSTLEYELTPRR